MFFCSDFSLFFIVFSVFSKNNANRLQTTSSTMSAENSYRSLVSQFEKTKKELGEAETTIRRITGRDPDEASNVQGSGKYRWKGSFASGATSSRTTYYGKKRPTPYTNSYWKRSKGSESSYEDSADEDESPQKKPSLSSTVVANYRERKTRKATIEEQNANTPIKERNKRMFSKLIGFLERFQHEEIKRQDKGSMRAQIEQKVEAATEEEREKIRREKDNLFHTRREKQSQLRCLEKKIERAECHEVYDANYRHLQNFIMTKSKPPILYRPASHNARSKKRLEESRNHIKEIRKARENDFETDLCDIEGWYKKEQLLGNKENKSPKEGESHDVPEAETEALVVEQEDTSHVEEHNEPKNVGSLTEDFEPIYD